MATHVTRGRCLPSHDVGGEGRLASPRQAATQAEEARGVAAARYTGPSPRVGALNTLSLRAKGYSFPNLAISTKKRTVKSITWRGM